MNLCEQGTVHRHLVRGLYAITPDDLPATSLLPILDGLFADGLRLLQVRRKYADRRALEDEARAIVTLAAPHGACVIINDDAELALDCGAHGVHWGRDDAASDLVGLRAQIADIKARANGSFVVGISCYDRFERAEMAQAAGADYVAFGSFFPSPTKPHAVRADLSLLSQTSQRLNTPSVAIGGITRDNAQLLVAAGASAIAVISDLFAPAYQNAAMSAPAATSANIVAISEVVSRARLFHRVFANKQTQPATPST